MAQPRPPVPNRVLTEDDPLVVLVVGASLAAEQIDRPIAAYLAVQLAAAAPQGSSLAPAVVTDLWYLNHAPLRMHPAVAIGPADRNAFSAFLLGRLPRVFSIDHRLSIHLDLHLESLVACLHGVDAQAGAEAAAIFLERYAAGWLAAAAARA